MSPSMEKARIDHQVLNPLFSGTEPDRNTLAEYQIHLAAFFCISVPEHLERCVGKHPEKLWVKIPNYFCLSTYQYYLTPTDGCEVAFKEPSLSERARVIKAGACI